MKRPPYLRCAVVPPARIAAASGGKLQAAAQVLQTMSAGCNQLDSSTEAQIGTITNTAAKPHHHAQATD